jgi:hypothetical protein
MEMKAMQIISHRGYWKSPGEKNTLAAFERSFSLGFGTETDIRDFRGELVISHDVPAHPGVRLVDVLRLAKHYAKEAHPLPLALNVKADGLQNLLRGAIQEVQYENYFVFDMSVPDAVVYWRERIPFYTRESEYESNPALLEECHGVWMDCFQGEWYAQEDVRKHLNHGKQVCLVSPELHKRDPKPLWKNLKAWRLDREPQLILCTDLPEDASDFFDL